MKAANALRREIMVSAVQNNDFDATGKDLETDEGVAAAYDQFTDSDVHFEYEREFRSGEIKTEIETPGSRYYESRSVAMPAKFGLWIGWTYWYGGGKHGEPESVEWIDDAYYLTCVEVEKIVTVRTFTKVEE